MAHAPKMTFTPKATLTVLTLWAVGLILGGAAWSGQDDAGAPAFDETCGIIAERSDGRTETLTRPGFSVVAATAAGGALTVPPPTEGRIAAVWCRRDSLVPEPDDDGVVRAGYAFHIAGKSDGGGYGRLILERQGGQITARLAEGGLTAQEQRALDSRLAAFNRR